MHISALTAARLSPKLVLPNDGKEETMCKIFAGQDPARYEQITRRLRLNGQSTSIRLERTFWDIMDDLAESQGMTAPVFMSKLHAEVLELHGEPKNFASLLRCCCLIHLETNSVNTDRLMAAE